MRRHYLLVEFDTKARLGGRDDVAVLPADRFLENLGVEAVEAADALLDQKVRAARIHLDVGRGLDGAALEMRRDLRVVRLRHASDLPRFQNAANAP